jgi:aspartyl-tRNA(Asn)/glutamyl-tRNA(Gln) amidotransferase subunit B
MMALALNFKISKFMIFFRKNYFYPDMSKNFQITQYDKAGGVPFAINGFIKLDNGKKVRIRRMQLEEDPAKLIYDSSIESSTKTFADFNRAGIALIELVTDPDINNPHEAREFLNKLSSIVEHLGVSDLSKEGSVRCDANISLSGGHRVEVKNISSFKEVERALTFETTRQKSLSAKQISIQQETRHWDDVRRITISLRLKEKEEDYRYFPESDLVPIKLADEFIKGVQRTMPELPEARESRFIREHNLSKEIAKVLVKEKFLADFFEETSKLCTNFRELGNWIAGDLQRYINETGTEFNHIKLTPNNLAKLINRVDNGKVSRSSAKQVFLEMLNTEKELEEILVRKEFNIISDQSYLEKLVGNIFSQYPKAVEDSLRDEKTINFLVGKIMKITKGRTDPADVIKIVQRKLNDKKELN